MVKKKKWKKTWRKEIIQIFSCDFKGFFKGVLLVFVVILLFQDQTCFYFFIPISVIFQHVASEV